MLDLSIEKEKKIIAIVEANSLVPKVVIIANKEVDYSISDYIDIYVCILDWRKDKWKVRTFRDEPVLLLSSLHCTCNEILQSDIQSLTGYHTL